VTRRAFFFVDIDSLGYTQPDKKAFENLKINPKHKSMVTSTVHANFSRQKFAKKSNNSNMSQDIIKGKGNGLIILLHGVPGVGKTAVAEAVAETNRKPLFAITCGDLGITPKEVESSLVAIF
jgi:SpoVK/Ycf46/Vps4 family AAA+-type ATPase